MPQPRSGDRPRVLYLSYDGAAEPLGRSQVVSYLVGLAAEHDITLVSFEKDDRERASISAELTAAGITWIPLRYHGRPAVLSTAYDSAAGRRALVRAAKSAPPDIVHVRSYVPALMALMAARRTGAALLFDIRGFWADERVEGGLWRAGGVLHRVAKRAERAFFARADAVVTLTAASLPRIRSLVTDPDTPVVVIPTCVDAVRFAETQARTDGPHAVWSGSLGTWYRFDLVPRLTAALGLPLTVLTRQAALARRMLGDVAAEVTTVSPDTVPAAMHAGDVGLCLVRSGGSKIASAPTRFAEYLAAGMPVVVTPQVGDLAPFVEDHGVGAVLRGEDERAVRDAAASVRALAAQPEVQTRCRAVARDHFDLEDGIGRYAKVYDLLLEREARLRDGRDRRPARGGVSPLAPP